MDLQNLVFNLFSGKLFGLNWVDFIIIFIIFIYALEGYFLKFIAALIDFISFVLAFIFGLYFYIFLAKLLVVYLKIPQGFSNAIGFLVMAVIFEIIFAVILKLLIKKINYINQVNQIQEKSAVLANLLGVLPGIMSGIVLSAFILSLIISLPFSVFLKKSVSQSVLGSVLVANTQGFSKNINDVFGLAVNDALSFLTVKPDSNETVNLNFNTAEIQVDRNSERDMFNLVNKERKANGLIGLEFSENLAIVGRKHCSDMFRRGYFSHNTPEGLSPFDRMLARDLIFNNAGENLALAPNTELAMKGLMQSKGHRENILSNKFNKVGIAAIDGGIYGIMFCQEFSD